MDELNPPVVGSEPSGPGATPILAVRPAPRSVFGTVVWVAILALSWGGLWVTSALSEAHRAVPHGEKGLLASACSPNMGEGISCDQVLQSRWALQWVPNNPAVAVQWVGDRVAMLRGQQPPTRGKQGWLQLPVAWLGMVYFSVVGTWFLFVGQPSYSRRWLHLLVLIVLGGALIGSGRFMHLLLFRMTAMCPLCVMTHAINLLLFVGAVLLWPKRPAEVAGVTYAPRPSWKQVATTVVLMWFVMQVVLTGQAIAQSGSEVAAYQARLNEYESNPRVQWELVKEKLTREKKYAIPVDADDPIMGPANAARTFVLFSDFQCPSCKMLHDRLMEFWPELQRIAAPMGGVRLVYKHYPLYVRCNPRSATNMHAYSCDAAKAAEAARMVGGPEAFWKMGALLYKNQQDLDLAPYATYAAELGLDVPAFEKARRSTEAAERVARHVQEGAGADMSSTPGLYLDGVRITEIGKSGLSIWGYILRLPEWPPTEATLGGSSAGRRPAPATARTAAPTSAKAQ